MRKWHQTSSNWLFVEWLLSVANFDRRGLIQRQGNWTYLAWNVEYWRLFTYIKAQNNQEFLAIVSRPTWATWLIATGMLPLKLSLGKRLGSTLVIYTEHSKLTVCHNSLIVNWVTAGSIGKLISHRNWNTKWKIKNTVMIVYILRSLPLFAAERISQLTWGLATRHSSSRVRSWNDVCVSYHLPFDWTWLRSRCMPTFGSDIQLLRQETVDKWTEPPGLQPLKSRSVKDKRWRLVYNFERLMSYRNDWISIP